MKPHHALAPLLLAALLAGPAMAQDTAAPAAPAEAATETETPNTDAATGLSLGETVADENGPGSTYVAETHGDWDIRCIRVEEGAFEPCQLYQLLRDGSGNAVAEFNMFDLPDEGQVVAGATIVTPLDTMLTPQLRIRVDEGAPQRYPFAFCQPIGCFVRLGLTAADLAAFRAGGEATITIVPLPAPDQTVDVVASLVGFTAGFAALEARTAEAIAAAEAAQ